MPRRNRLSRHFLTLKRRVDDVQRELAEDELPNVVLQAEEAVEIVDGTTLSVSSAGFTVETTGSSNIDTSSANLEGELLELDGAASADCGFEYRKKGASTWQTTGTDTLTTETFYSRTLSSLSSGTTYEFRADGTASDGDTDTGKILTFTTDGLTGKLHQWETSAGSGTTVTDTEGSADISLSGASWDSTTDSWKSTYAIQYDGTDDYGRVSSNQLDPGDTGALVLTVRFQSTESFPTYVFSHDNGSGRRIWVRADGSGNLDVVANDGTVSLTSISTATTYRAGLKWDTGTVTGYLNGNKIGSTSYTDTVSLTLADWFFGSNDTADNFLDGFIDNPIIGDDAWTDQQFTDDYNNQPWS